jgi:hypothetical protein
MTNNDDDKDLEPLDSTVVEPSDEPTTGRRSTPWLANERAVLDDTPEEIFAAGVILKTGFGSWVAGKYPNNLCQWCDLYYDDDVFERCPLCAARDIPSGPRQLGAIPTRTNDWPSTLKERRNMNTIGKGKSGISIIADSISVGGTPYIPWTRSADEPG